jgi:hypothetical protein
LEGYDYSTDNLYFITSCLQDRKCCFGEIVNNLMILKEFGKIAHNQFVWLQNQIQSPKPLKIKSLSELIGAYKTTVSKQIHLAGEERFNWQKSFHDRIIRNEMEFGRIINYIDENPSNWKKEKLNVLLTAI